MGSMKVRKIFYRFFIFALALMVGLGIIFAVQNKQTQSASAVEHKILYSTNNAPIFYGATKITIDKNVTENFSIKDSRFRIYAKDFEDGDLSSKIECISNNVNSTTPGNYEIKYRVKDSHNNEVIVIVPVVVLDKTDGECTIERTLYTLQNDWNITLIGVGRNRNGDRQNLGIYMPEGTSANIKIINADSNFTIWMLGNYETKETNFTLNATQTDYKTFSNVKNSTSYSCVPFAGSVIQAEGEDVNKTYKIEVNFDSSVKPLDYYLYKDNEDDFMSNWKLSQNDFGVIDCQAMQIIVPFTDIDKISKRTYSQAIGTLDESLEYFMKVIDRMDEILGVSINPKSPLDQNVRMKYFAKANGNKTSVGAYYTNNHIAVGSASAWPLFTYGWGTLHECGHGYQGYLGQGSANGLNMCLNETGNNVFAYYIQSDKTIYKAAGSNVGELKNIENGRNAKRLNGQDIFNNNNGTYTNTDEKLYMIVNMLDSFEGYKTYAKMYSYFRKSVYENGANAYTIPEIYTMFFAETYGVNIMPYLYAWGLPVGSNVAYEIMQKNLKSYSILADSVGEENLQNIKTSENLMLSYGLISEEVLSKYSIKGNLKLTINLPEFSKIQNRVVALFSKGKMVAKSQITSNEIEFKNIDVGIYEVRLPVIYDYDNQTLVLSVNNGENMAEYSYIKSSMDFSDRTQKLFQLGYHRYSGSIGFSIELSNYNKRAKIDYGGGYLLNQSGEWLTTKANDTFISFQILNNTGDVVFEKSVKGNKDYFSKQGMPENPYVDVDYGYKVVIYTEMPNYVRIKSVLTGTELSQYNTTSKNISYEITRYGFKLLNVENFDEETIMYNDTKNKTINFIEDYKSSVTNEELGNKRINAKKKNEVISAYESLKNADREIYTEFVNKIKTGGLPVIKKKVNSVTIKPKETIDLYSLIEASDNEDIYIAINQTNVVIETNFNNNVAGEYVVKYIVKDSDSNVSTCEINITVESPGNSGGSTNTPDTNPDTTPDADTTTDETKSSRDILWIISMCVLAVLLVLVVIIVVLEIKRKK